MKLEHQAVGGPMPERGRDGPVAPILIVVGGFLGAGKTTTILQSARHLRSSGQRVAIITNDQAGSLVDTEVARTGSDDVVEIPDGCFCCQYDRLHEALVDLATANPDVILAEAVGSCTDLAATVCQPLRQLNAGTVRIGPLSVVADGIRLRDNLHGAAALQPDIAYLHERQLAEADVIMLNKVDLLTDAERLAIIEHLASRYPGATIFPISATTGIGVDDWCSMYESAGRFGENVLDLDYDRYAAAEASLGWVNLAGTIETRDGGTPETWLRAVIDHTGGSSERETIEIAHLKIWIETSSGSVRGNLVGRNKAPTIAGSGTPGLEGRFLVNARAPVAPGVLRSWIDSAIADAATATSAAIELTEGTAFRPARPVPIHRLLPLAPGTLTIGNRELA